MKDGYINLDSDFTNRDKSVNIARGWAKRVKDGYINLDSGFTNRDKFINIVGGWPSRNRRFLAFDNNPADNRFQLHE
jgi:hypothetical protein